jgi:hypothetical protein
MPEITFTLPVFHFADAKATQMLSKRLTDQRGTIHVSPSGSLVDGAQQLGIESDLNGLHTWSLPQEETNNQSLAEGGQVRTFFRFG